MKNNNMIIMVVAVVIVGAASFYGGMRYQQTKIPTGARQFMMGANGQGFRTGAAGGTNRAGGSANTARPVVGEILSQDDKSITVKLQDGSSKIVLLPETTTYSKTSTGTKADLKVGGKVGVFGTANADGSVTAQAVQEDPSFGIAGAAMMRTVIESPTPAAK